MSEDWIEVTNVKKIKIQQRRQTRMEENERWQKLETEIPWIVVPSRARRIRQKLNITRLDEKFLSEEWIEYQRQGWNYIRVVRPDEVVPSSVLESTRYSFLSIDNKWGDRALFSRTSILEDRAFKDGTS